MADFNLVDDINFEKICRLCLSHVGPMLSLSELVLPGITSRKRTPVRRADKVFYSVSVLIPVIEKDDLPYQICQKCDSLINDYYSFKETCTVVDHKLHRLAKRRRDLHNSRLKKPSQTKNISTPKENISRTDTSNNSVDPNVIKPCSKLNDSNYYKSKHVPNSAGTVKPTDCQFVDRPTPPMNPSVERNDETTMESVMVGDSPFVDEKCEDAVDPLAIKLEDIKNANFSTYNNKFRGCRKDVDTESSFVLMKAESAAVRSVTDDPLSSPRSTAPCGVASGTFVLKETRTPSLSPYLDILACDINLHHKMRREDCTINIFSCKDTSINTIKLLDFDNRLVPCIPNLDDPTPLLPKEGSTPVQHHEVTSPGKDEPVVKVHRWQKTKTIIVPRKRTKPQYPPKESMESPKVPRYTYSRRCSNLREVFPCDSEEPRASHQPSTEEATSSVPNNHDAEVSSNPETSQPSTEEKTSSVPNHGEPKVSSNPKELSTSQTSTEEKTSSVPNHDEPKVSSNSGELSTSQTSTQEKTSPVPNRGEPKVSSNPGELSMSQTSSVPDLGAEVPPNSEEPKKSGDRTPSKMAATRHWSPVEPSRTCIECGETFDSYPSLVTHIRTHDAVIRVVSCALCDKTFKSDTLLASHVYMRHRSKIDRSSLCHLCGAVFDDRRNLDHHLNKHLGRKDFLCDTCGAKYYSRYDLVHHIRRKHLEADRPKSKCRHCDVELSTPESLRRHLALHAGVRNEKCPLCPKMFASRQQVERHMRSHTGETPFVCEVCKRGFTLKWNYTQHMRLHTKIKPYVCDVCGKAFTHNVSRRSHMSRHKREEEEEGGKAKAVGVRVPPVELSAPVTE